ncbi:MAG: hypothetical protein LIO79_06505 [Rikenellaceae bacterium]|nr:hypothetical protein [Rikenellaceae bacterium]
MVKDHLQDNFIKAMKSKVPERGKLANRLTEILSIEKEAVYRRLRGEVPFSVTDVVLVANDFNISADEIFGNVSPKSRPYQLKMTEFYDMQKADYANLEQFLESIKTLKDSPDTEISVAYNMIPQTLYLAYDNIYHFYLFKWAFHNSKPENTKCFSEVVPSGKLLEINKRIIKQAREAGNTCYIWDDMIFDSMVNDIKYFLSIRLITKEEVSVIREELLGFIDDIERIAARGRFDSGNKVQFYVSNIRFESSCSYIETASGKMSLIKSFTLNDVISVDEDVFEKTKSWISSLKRTSNLISESGEVERIRFFDKQRDIINRL